MAIRVAVTGRTATPPLFDTLVALGRERTLERLDRAMTRSWTYRNPPGLIVAVDARDRRSSRRGSRRASSVDWSQLHAVSRDCIGRPSRQRGVRPADDGARSQRRRAHDCRRSTASFGVVQTPLGYAAGTGSGHRGPRAGGRLAELDVPGTCGSVPASRLRAPRPHRGRDGDPARTDAPGLDPLRSAP